MRSAKHRKRSKRAGTPRTAAPRVRTFLPRVSVGGLIGLAATVATLVLMLLTLHPLRLTMAGLEPKTELEAFQLPFELKHEGHLDISDVEVWLYVKYLNSGTIPIGGGALGRLTMTDGLGTEFAQVSRLQPNQKQTISFPIKAVPPPTGAEIVFAVDYRVRTFPFWKGRDYFGFVGDKWELWKWQDKTPSADLIAEVDRKIAERPPMSGVAWNLR